MRARLRRARGNAAMRAGARTIASRSVRLPRLAVTRVRLSFDAGDLAVLRAVNGRATMKLALRRAGGKKTAARRTLTLRLSAYDDFEFTLIDGRITITKTPLVPVYCFENGAGHSGNALSFEPFAVSGPWNLGADESVEQSGIAVNRLVSSGSRGITYKVTETAATASSVTGKLGMSFFDSKYDIFTNQIWFVNCSGSQSFEAVPAA